MGTREPYSDAEKRRILLRCAELGAITKGCADLDLRVQTITQWLTDPYWRRYYDDLVMMPKLHEQEMRLRPILARLYSQLESSAYLDTDPAEYEPVLRKLVEVVKKSPDDPEAIHEALLETANRCASVSGRSNLSDMSKILSLIQQTNKTLKKVAPTDGKQPGEEPETPPPSKGDGSPLGFD